MPNEILGASCGAISPAPAFAAAPEAKFVAAKFLENDLPATRAGRLARRCLSLHFPRLPTDRILRLRHGPRWRTALAGKALPGPPLIIAGKRDNAMRLVALDERASRAGLSAGQALADARAMLPGIEIAAEDGSADALLLAALADWCDRYTPLVAIGGGDGGHDKGGKTPVIDAPGRDWGLLLDIAGCAHLFGGERALIADVLARLFDMGFAAEAAIASTPGAAFALARFADKPRDGKVTARAETARALAPLGLAALRLDGETVAGLARLGLYRIGDLMSRPRAPLARRFGRQLLLRLDQATGAIDEPVSPRLLAPALSAERRLAEPLSRIGDIEILIARLAGHLAGELQKREEGARVLDLALWRVDGHVARLGVGASRPLADGPAIAALFGERLIALGDNLDAGYGFDMARLSVAEVEPCQPCARDFLEEKTGDPAGLARLLDRLGARLGIANVLLASPVDTHRPEAAERLSPAATGNLPAGKSPPKMPVAPNAAPNAAPNTASDAATVETPVRPLRLFACPEPVEAMAAVPDGPPLRFRWRRALREVTAAEGPERIGGEWWKGKTPTRDYFRVEDARGRRYWLYRDGLYGETAEPRWFLHGLFA
jgi:protein ImuB